VLLVDDDGSVVEKTLDALLPDAFGPQDLAG
jgi:cytidine deaminase